LFPKTKSNLTFFPMNSFNKMWPEFEVKLS
jgi:hypothetical protein